MGTVNAPFCILTIAGSDSGGGAGVQVDQRTIRSIGGHALTAVTAVTAQDTRRVSMWKPVPNRLIRAQVESALQGFPVAAIKTGLIPGAGAVRAISAALSAYPFIPLVVDPVLGSTSGTRFLSGPGLRVLKSELFCVASLITPNWPEVSLLTGRRVTTHAQAARAATELSEACGRPVLVKGGHGPGETCRDCLVTPGGDPVWFESPRVETPNTHGTGCVLSAAIAAWLGRGASLSESVRLARSFLHRALIRGRSIAWGAGRGTAFYGTR